jgi:glycosyltransferase involved in cell wall biosynthesis
MIDHKAPYLTSRRFSLTVHDVTFLDNPEWYPRHVAAYKRQTLTLSLRRGPALIVCYSHDTLRRLRRHHPSIPEDRLRVIYPGVSEAPPPGSTAAPPPDPYFLTVSAVERRKNHLGLLRAFERARGAGLQLGWKIVGGPQYGGEEIMAQLREQPGVEVLGRVDDAELERLYRRATFVALPSWAEGFGYPPLEAMAREVPVACSTGSGLDETAGEAALRVPPEDVDGWATALLRLAGDGKLRRDLVARGRAQVQRFSWQQSAARHLQAFREVVHS